MKVEVKTIRKYYKNGKLVRQEAEVTEEIIDDEIKFKYWQMNPRTKRLEELN